MQPWRTYFEHELQCAVDAGILAVSMQPRRLPDRLGYRPVPVISTNSLKPAGLLQVASGHGRTRFDAKLVVILRFAGYLHRPHAGMDALPAPCQCG